MDIIEVIIKDLNTQQKRNTVLSQDILLRCSYLIRKDKWDSVNSFINCTFFSDEDINQMKKVFVQGYGRGLAISFLREREFHKLDRFLNWAFQSEEEVSSFRESLNSSVSPSFH